MRLGSNAKPLGPMSVIAPASFITSLALGFLSLGFLFVAKDVLGAKPAVVASLGAAFSLSYFIGCVTLRSVVSRFRPRSAMLVNLFAGVALLSAFVAWPGIIQAYVAYSLYGFMTAFFWPPVMGWLARGLEGKELGKATSLFSVSWSVGGMVGSYLAGVLSELGKFAPLYAAIAMFLLNAAFVVASKSFMRDEPAARGLTKGEPRGDDRSTPLRYPAWAGAFIAYLVMGVIFNVFPVFARDELSMSESGVGFVLMLRAMSTALGFYLVGRSTFWQFKRTIMPILSAATALILVAIYASGSAIGYGLGFAVFGLLMSMIYNNSLFYATSGAPDRDRRATIHEALLTFGNVTGSVAGGALYQAFSMSAVFAILAIALALGAFAQAAMVAGGPAKKALR